MRYECTIRETIEYTLFVEAESGREAGQKAYDEWERDRLSIIKGHEIDDIEIDVQECGS